MANFFPAALLLLLFFNPLALEAATASSLIASIDCGASKAYTDDLGIPWTGDSSLIKTGKAETVPGATSFSQAMQTLRVFSTGTRNCYTISIPGGGQVLVRATFFYGNYDGNKKPPTFDLEFDGNTWSTVKTSVDTVISKEAIFAVSGGSISVCVVQTKAGELPFVSGLEVRGLGDSLYSRYDRTSSALVLTLRTAVGLAAPVRYPDDPYDRIWNPFDAPKTVDVVKNEASSIETGIKDAPPAAIFQYAVTPTAGSNDLLFTVPLPSETVAAYINMYFTEVTELAAGDNRTFQIFVDSTAASDPLVPSFGGVTEFYMANLSASSSTQIQLKPTADATLPPVISALEAFVIIPISGGGGGAAAGPGGGDAPPVSDSPPVSDGPPSSDKGSPSDSATTPSNESPSDTSSPENGPPTDKSVPAGSAFGGGKKGNPSFGNKVKVERLLGIVIGFVVPILFLNFV